MANDVTQQINLYLPEFRPRNDWVSVSRLLAILLAVCLLAGLLSGVDYWRRHALQQQLAGLQTQLASQQAVTEQLEKSLASRATDQTLLNEVGTRQASLDQLNGTLEALRNASHGSLSGFSEYLKNLSSASVEGLWLTDISISEGGSRATLQGYAVESAMVPGFVDRLSRGWKTSPGWRFTRITGAAADSVMENGKVAATELAAAANPLLRDAYRFKLETH